MTVQVNLLPIEYRLRATRPRRLRLWIALAVAVVVAEGISSVGLRLTARDTREAAWQTARMQEAQGALVKELASLSATKRDLARQVALAEQLRRKHRWSRTLGVLSAQVPDGVMLTSLTTDPPRASESGKDFSVAGGLPRRPRRDGEKNPNTETALGLILEGVAMDHTSMAALLSALNRQPEFGTCELKSANRQAFLDDHAIAFTVCTRW